MGTPSFEIQTYKWRGGTRDAPENTTVTGLLVIPRGCKLGRYLLDFKADDEWSTSPTPTDFLVAGGKAQENYKKIVSNGVEFEWRGNGELRFTILEDNEEVKIELMVLSARKHYLTNWKINYEDDPGSPQVSGTQIDLNLVKLKPETIISEFRLEWLEGHRGDYLHPKQLLTSKGIREWFLKRQDPQHTPIKLLYFGLDDGCNLLTALQTLDSNGIEIKEVHVVKDFNPSSQDDHSSVTDVLSEVYEQSKFPEPNSCVYGFTGERGEHDWKKDDYYDLIIDTYALPWSPSDRYEEIRDRLRSLVPLRPHKPGLHDEDDEGEGDWRSSEVPVDELLQNLESGELKFSEEDDWSNQTKVQYIESILHDDYRSRSPIVIETVRDEPEIIRDGIKRLTTLHQFANGEFPVGHDDPYTGEQEWFFSELDANQRGAIMGKVLTVQTYSTAQQSKPAETSDEGSLILTFPRYFNRVAFEVGPNRTELENLNENLAEIIQTDFLGPRGQSRKHKDLVRSYRMTRDDDVPGMKEPKAADLAEDTHHAGNELLLKSGEEPYEQLSTAYKEARAQKRGKLPRKHATSEILTDKIRDFLADYEKTHLIIEADGKWGKTVLTADSVCSLLDGERIGGNDGSVSWFTSAESTDSATPTSENLTVIDDVQTRISDSGNGAVTIAERLNQWDSDSENPTVCKKFILIVSSDASQAPRAETNADELHHKLHALFGPERLDRIHIAKQIFHLDPTLIVDVIKSIWNDMDFKTSQNPTGYPISGETVRSVMSWCRSSVSTKSFFDILDSYRAGGTNDQTPKSSRCTSLTLELMAKDEFVLTMPGIRGVLGMGEGGLS